MIDRNIHKPNIEDIIALSGVDTLPPGGTAITKRMAELAGMKPGLHVLVDSSARGDQAVYYALHFGVKVTGIDIAEEMVRLATENARKNGLEHQVRFQQADSQSLPFEDNTFDVVTNEGAVGIPQDPQEVLHEMVRVVKPGGVVIFRESTWMKKITEDEWADISARLGSVPRERDQWVEMLNQAGALDVITEFEPWKNPATFWKVRKEREVNHYSEIFTNSEKMLLGKKILKEYGPEGLMKASENEKLVYQAILDGKLGYGLYKGVK